MKSFIKHIFLVVGTMVASLLLFAMMFGDTGREFLWRGIEPVMQSNWENTTLKDGKLLEEHYKGSFSTVTEVLHWNQ